MGNSSGKKLDLSLYKNIIYLDDGIKKVYLHNYHTSYCAAFCSNPNCNHGTLGVRWSGDEYYCYVDEDGYVIDTPKTKTKTYQLNDKA